MPRTVTLTDEQAAVAAAVLNHALEQAHDSPERDYLQFLLTDEPDTGYTDAREHALEELVGSILDLVAPPKDPA